MANEYVTSAEFKATTTLTGTSFADTDISAALEAASRGIDEATDRFFYQSTGATYYYSPAELDLLEIDDLATLTALRTDPDGDGTFQYTWTLHTDFELEPLNASARSAPWTRIRRRPAGNYWFPTGEPRSVEVIGTFGWPAVPPAIKQATSLLAARLLKRAREAPFGVVAIGVDVGAVARIASTDPDVAMLVNPFIKDRVLVG